MLSKTEWSWELSTWLGKMSLIDISTTFLYCFYWKSIGTGNENLNFDILGFKELTNDYFCRLCATTEIFPFFSGQEESKDIIAYNSTLRSFSNDSLCQFYTRDSSSSRKKTVNTMSLFTSMRASSNLENKLLMITLISVIRRPTLEINMVAKVRLS